jgi:exodeoxyribonuclease VIII
VEENKIESVTELYETLGKGGVFDISNSLYHSGPGISRSAIMEFKKTPKHYWYKYINSNYVSKPSTPQQAFGTAVHSYILEPQLFNNEYHIDKANPYDGRTVQGKKYKADQLIKAGAKTIIADDDFNAIKAIHNSIYDNNTTRELVLGAQYEKSIYWRDKETGLLCKCRPDIWHEHFVVDLKTSSNANPRLFASQMYSGGYHIQAAMIQEGILATQNKKVESFLNLVVETDEPHVTATYPISPQAIEQGKAEFKNILKQIKYCLDQDVWPGYPTQEIDIPPYAYNEVL